MDDSSKIRPSHTYPVEGWRGERCTSHTAMCVCVCILEAANCEVYAWISVLKRRSNWSVRRDDADYASFLFFSLSLSLLSVSLQASFEMRGMIGRIGLFIIHLCELWIIPDVDRIFPCRRFGFEKHFLISRYAIEKLFFARYIALREVIQFPIATAGGEGKRVSNLSRKLKSSFNPSLSF